MPRIGQIVTLGNSLIIGEIYTSLERGVLGMRNWARWTKSPPPLVGWERLGPCTWGPAYSPSPWTRGFLSIEKDHEFADGARLCPEETKFKIQIFGLRANHYSLDIVVLLSDTFRNHCYDDSSGYRFRVRDDHHSIPKLLPTVQIVRNC